MTRLILLLTLLAGPLLAQTCTWKTAPNSRVRYQDCGIENPYLDFRVRAVTSTADGAILRFTAYSTAACIWTIDSTRAFSGSLGSVGQSRTGRDGTATVTGLSSNTGYWYRVTCDATTRDGQFVTTH